MEAKDPRLSVSDLNIIVYLDFLKLRAFIYLFSVFIVFICHPTPPISQLETLDEIIIFPAGRGGEFAQDKNAKQTPKRSEAV